MQDKKRKMIVVAVGVVQRGDSILMTLRNEEINREAHLKWELPGGKVEFNEAPQNALMREVGEETGYQIKVTNPRPALWTKVWEYPDFLQHTLVLAFLCETIGEQKQTEDKKVRAVEWKKIDEIDYSKSLAGTKELINELFQQDSRR